MKILIDTGPLYAFFNKRDQWNSWTGEQFGKLLPPFYTCEAILSETIFLMQNSNINPDVLMKLISREHLVVNSSFTTKNEQQQISSILRTYRNLPASFADSCLVCLAENTPDSTILTLDSDFTLYRKNNGKPLSLITPFQN